MALEESHTSGSAADTSFLLQLKNDSISHGRTTSIIDGSDVERARQAGDSTALASFPQTRNRRGSAEKFQWRNNIVVDRNGREHDYYDYWLNYRIRPPVWHPSHWIVSLEPDTTKLPIDLREDPLRVLNHDESDLDLVRICLETFVARACQETRSRSEARERYKSTNVGVSLCGPLLMVSLVTCSSRDVHYRVDLVVDRHWGALLAHCLVAQDQKSAAISNWLRVDHVPMYAADLEPQDQEKWRESLLRQALESLAYWSDNPHTGLNDCLIFFCHEFELQEDVKVGKSAAGDWLLTRLFSTDTRRIDVEPYEKIMCYRLAWQRPGTLSRDWNHARLLLCHPKGPRPQAAYEFFKHIDTHHSEFWEMGDTPFDQSVIWILRRAAQALHAKGSTDRAKELLSMGRERLPEYCAEPHRKHRAKYDLDAVHRLFGGQEHSRTDIDRRNVILTKNAADRQARYVSRTNATMSIS